MEHDDDEIEEALYLFEVIKDNLVISTLDVKCKNLHDEVVIKHFRNFSVEIHVNDVEYEFSRVNTPSVYITLYCISIDLKIIQNNRVIYKIDTMFLSLNRKEPFVMYIDNKSRMQFATNPNDVHQILEPMFNRNLMLSINNEIMKSYYNQYLENDNTHEFENLIRSSLHI